MTLVHLLNISEVRMDHDLGLGDVYILDAKDLTVSHAMKTSPMVIKKMDLVGQVSTYMQKVRELSLKWDT